MKSKRSLIIRSSLLALFSTVGLAQAVILEFDLSPVGLASANNVPPVTVASAGSGNEISDGITYNTDTNTLTLAVGYGFAAGFTNLTGATTGVHLHGPAATTASGALLLDLATRHFPAVIPAQGGTVFGNVTLSDAQEITLLNDLVYLDIHTAANTSGELRAQLVRANSAPGVVCEEDLTVECGKLVTYSANVSDFDGDAVQVVWSLNGKDVKTINILADTTPPTTQVVTYEAKLHEGSNILTVTATDSEGDATTCDIIVTAEDTLPPKIVAISASPKVLWPPNGKMVTVLVNAKVVDLCDECPTWKIVSVKSDQAGGSSNIRIIDNHTVALRAKRDGGDKDGRTYTIRVVATDDAGNQSEPRTVTVTVPHDQGKK